MPAPDPESPPEAPPPEAPRPERRRSRPPEEPSRAPRWPVLPWLVMGALLLYLVFGQAGGPVEELSYTAFKRHVREGHVAEVTLEGPQVRGRYTEAYPERRAREAEGESEGEAAPDAPPDRFATTAPAQEDPDLVPLLERHGVEIRAEAPGGPWWANALLMMLPWILILGLIFYVGYRMQQRMLGGGRGGPFGFGRSPAKRFRHGLSDVTFDDVAGLESAKRDLKEIVDYLAHPERYRAIGAKIPRGILLLGPPGTGKTLLAKAAAGEAEVPFFSISGSEFIEMFVGVGASRVRDMFGAAKRESPSIVFIDEIDSVGRARGTGLGGGHDEREQTLNQILNEMDGFAPHENVVVLAATNRPDVLDAALLRPGRFDRKVTLELPGREAREKILGVHTRQVPLADDVDLAAVSRRTVGFSGADLENLANEASLLAARERAERVTMEHFDRARDRIVLGAEREVGLSEADKERVACHEAGHALLAWLLPEADPPEKVTIIPRGRALGATETLTDEEHPNLTRGFLLDRIGVMLGGRVAERLVYGEVTTGSEQDLVQATGLARRMVARWGMSERLGPLAFRHGEEHVFLGREIAQERDFSEHTARVIDEEISALVGGVEERALELVRDHRKQLDRLVEALLERETLAGEEIGKLLEAP